MIITGLPALKGSLTLEFSNPQERSTVSVLVNAGKSVSVSSEYANYPALLDAVSRGYVSVTYTSTDQATVGIINQSVQSTFPRILDPGITPPNQTKELTIVDTGGYGPYIAKFYPRTTSAPGQLSLHYNSILTFGGSQADALGKIALVGILETELINVWTISNYVAHGFGVVAQNKGWEFINNQWVHTDPMYFLQYIEDQLSEFHWLYNSEHGEAPLMRLTGVGDLLLGYQALATSAQYGYLFLPSCPGLPTGVPRSYPGLVARIWDSVDKQEFINDGTGWTQNGGTVTSVGLQLPSDFVAGGPVTDHGNIPVTRTSYRVQNGVTRFCQTATPTANAVGDTWYNSAEGRDYFWNGTYWLSTVEHSMNVSVYIAVSSEMWMGSTAGPAADSKDMYVTRFNLGQKTLSVTQDISNYNGTALQVTTSNDASRTVLASMNSIGYIASGWNNQSYSVNAFVDTATKREFMFAFSQNGTPGDMPTSAEMVYRLVAR